MTNLFQHRENQDIRNEAPLNRYFHMLPNMYDDDLDPFQYRLLGHYVRCGKCTESTETTARNTKMTDDKVRSSRNDLKRLGYIEVETRKDGRLSVTVVDRMAENIERYTTKKPVPTPPSENREGGGLRKFGVKEEPGNRRTCY